MELQLTSSPFSEIDQSCKIEETNGFLQTACAEIYDGFAVYKCPYSDETYYIVDKLIFMRSNIFNATGTKFCVLLATQINKLTRVR